MREHILHQYCKYSGLILLSGLLLFGCAAKQQRLYPVQSSLMWPAKPAQARVQYKGSFRTPEEMGIEKGFFARLSDLITGEDEQLMIKPMAVVSVGEDVIYVADTGVKGIHYFNRQEGDYKLIQLADNRPLPSPVGMAVGPSGSVFVADSALGGIYVIKQGSDIAIPLKLKSKLKQPTGIAWDSQRHRLYVTDTATHTISIFDRNGNRLKQFGKRGKGKAEFNFPTLLWFGKNNQLYVTDSLNFRIQIFNRKGQFQGYFGKAGQTSGTLSRPKGVATDKFGHIYTVDSLFHALQIFDDKGRLLLNIGQQGSAPGEFWLPTGIFVSKNNTIYIADSYNRRVQVFQYLGGKS